MLLIWGLVACAGIPSDGGSGFAPSSQHQQQQQQAASQQQQQLQQLRLLHGGLEAMDEDEDTLQQPGSAGTGGEGLQGWYRLLPLWPDSMVAGSPKRQLVA